MAESKVTVSTPSELEFVMTRVFDAPRELVFEAYTRPEHIAHWWGQRGSTLPVCEIDPRPGGKWRFVSREKDGNEYGFRGEFREVTPPERIVWTFEFEGMPGHISVDTVQFEPYEGNKTRLVSSTLFASVEDRDGMLQSGMEEGAKETYERLEEYLATLTTR
jgi:uncharacterized protein YndB with AHSA1/START domain